MSQAGPLSAEEGRDKFDFDPPPPTERPLTSYLPEDLTDRTGLIVSGTGVAAGITLSLITAGAAVTHGLTGDPDGSFQRDLALTGACLISTAVFTVFTDSFLDRRRQSRMEQAISEE